jgi:imidazolonepropionase-like amidohydrolase
MKRTVSIILSALVVALVSPVPHATAGIRGVAIVDHGAMDPSISPDGAQIAVSIFGRLFVVPRSGGEARQLTDGIGWDGHPAWSPDGRFIAYSHQLPSGCDLIIRSLETGGYWGVYHTDATIGQIAFHPKKAEVFFLLDRSQYDSHLYKIDVDGGEAKQLTFAQNWHEWSFALSPDGSQVLLDSGRYGGSDLYRIALENLEAKRLTRTPAHEHSVGWSKDGHIAYIRTEEGIESVMVQPVDGPARAVFASEYDQKQLAVDPDGKSLVICSGRKLYRIKLEGGPLSSIPFTAHLRQADGVSGDLVITNARILDPGTDRDFPSGWVVIRDGRISEVHATQDAIGLPAGLPVVDAGGKTLMPGLMDNHYHYWSPFDGGRLLAAGITSIRDPGVAISTSLNFKEAISLGLLGGPDIYTCGPLIDGLGGYHPLVDVEIAKAESVAALVQSLKAQGVDALKVYFLLNPDVLRALVKEATSLGLPVTGHIGVRTGWREAIEAGISGFNHIRIWRDFLPPEKQPQGDEESLDSTRNMVARMQADWSEIDPDSLPVTRLIKMMAEKHIGFDPTLSIQHIEESQRKDLGIEPFELAQQSYRKMTRFVANAQRMGVLLLAGTDNGSLNDELEAYAAAGIPNKEILKAATINGAIWLGKKSEFGSLQRGARANLIIVDGDPLSDIRQLRRLSAVIKEGRFAFKN